MVVRIKSWLFGIRLHQVGLAFIVLLGLWLRLSNLSQTMWFFDGMDEARDVLVAKHIVEHHEVIWRGPFAAGGYFWLQNSPFYYYFLAGMWFFCRSAPGMVVLWACLSCTGIILSYWAGKLTQNSATGLLAALLYAIHPSLVVVGHQIMQPHVLPLFALGFYCSMITAWKQKSAGWLMVAAFWLVISLHFHYGGLLLWPVGGIALGITWIFASKRKWPHWILYLCYSCLLVSNILLFWLFLTFKYEPFDQIQFFTLNAARPSLPLLTKLAETAENFKILLVSYISNWASLSVVVAVLLSWLIQPKKLPKVFLFALFLSAAFSLGFKNYVAATYLLSLVPFWILLWASAIEHSWKRARWLGILAGLLTLWWWHDMSALAKADLPQRSFYLQYQDAANVMLADYQSLQPQDHSARPRLIMAELATYTGIPFDGWRVGPFWYFLEAQTQQQLVKLVDWDTNFAPLSNDFEYVYLVCDRRDEPEKIWSMCYRAFIANRNYLPEGEIIFDQAAFIIWRFKVDSERKPQSIYQTYPEYM